MSLIVIAVVVVVVVVYFVVIMVLVVVSLSEQSCSCRRELALAQRAQPFTGRVASERKSKSNRLANCGEPRRPEIDSRR